MGKLGPILIVSWIVITIAAAYVGFSIELNGLGLTAVWVVPIGFLIGLGLLSESARLTIIWHYSSRSLGGKEIGDLPNHVGGMFFEFRITVRNIGGKNLSLEPKMILHEVGSGKTLHEVKMMDDCPRSAIIADKVMDSQGLGDRPQHCPSPLPLGIDKQEKVHLEFFVDKYSMKQAGISKTHQAYCSLKFVDTIHGAFVFENKRNGVIKYKRLRHH